MNTCKGNRTRVKVLINCSCSLRRSSCKQNRASLTVLCQARKAQWSVTLFIHQFNCFLKLSVSVFLFSQWISSELSRVQMKLCYTPWSYYSTPPIFFIILICPFYPSSSSLPPTTSTEPPSLLHPSDQTQHHRHLIRASRPLNPTQSLPSLWIEQFIMHLYYGFNNSRIILYYGLTSL